ncbi:MAG: hypothetical protein N2645_04790 [Clostridia bacterium]|nr:hypothetical protein [Clostridia bacterium]
MVQKRRSWKNYLYVVTILFFTLGFFNIIFAWLGFACLTLPFILLAKNKRKTWCQGYCPRASLFGVLFHNRSLTGKGGPNWLVRGKAKWFVLIYFLFNLFVLTMSTLMVFMGRREPVESIRFLIAFTLPWDMPQFLNLGIFPDWTMHLSFRMYSMMFTTTVLGLLLAWIFKPRTWCTVCPVNTVSNLILDKTRNEV